MRPCRLATLLVLALPALGLAVDVPLPGHKISLRASASVARKRSASITIKDAALSAPLPDPTLGASLVVNAGAADGQCHV